MQNFTFLLRRSWLFLLLFQLFITAGAYAQQTSTVTGNVTSITGEALIGVSVLVKGTSNGTQTDLSGHYTLKVSGSDATLVFKYVGYLPKEVAVSGSKIDVQLTENQHSLNEVVVLGYGTANRRDVTGSVVSVKTADLPQVAVTSVNNMLQGQAAGLNLNSRSAQPDGG